MMAQEKTSYAHNSKETYQITLILRAIIESGSEIKIQTKWEGLLDES